MPLTPCCRLWRHVKKNVKAGGFGFSESFLGMRLGALSQDRPAVPERIPKKSNFLRFGTHNSGALKVGGVES